MLNMPSFVSCTKVQKLLKKGSIAKIAKVGKEETNEININEVPIVNEFLDVFFEELLGFLPDREVEFTIDLLPSTELISIPPY